MKCCKICLNLNVFISLTREKLDQEENKRKKMITELLRKCTPCEKL